MSKIFVQGVLRGTSQAKVSEIIRLKGFIRPGVNGGFYFTALPKSSKIQAV